MDEDAEILSTVHDPDIILTGSGSVAKPETTVRHCVFVYCHVD